MSKNVQIITMLKITMDLCLSDLTLFLRLGHYAILIMMIDVHMRCGDALPVLGRGYLPGTVPGKICNWVLWLPGTSHALSGHGLRRSSVCLGRCVSAIDHQDSPVGIAPFTCPLYDL